MTPEVLQNLSEPDLQALAAGDMSRVSTQGLKIISGTAKPPSKEWMAQTMAGMTLAGKPWYERAAIQMGAGADTLMSGVKQLFASKEEEKALQKEEEQKRLLKRALAKSSDTGRLPEWMPTGGAALQTVGEALPMMAVPAGTYVGAARMLPRAAGLMRTAPAPARLGTGALVTEGVIGGGLAGALNPTIEGESRSSNILVGAASGGALPGVVAGGRYGLGMVTQAGGQRRAGEQIAKELAEEAGIPAGQAAEQAVQRLRQAGPGPSNIPLSTAAVLNEPSLARLERGSRAVNSGNWYDFDVNQARAISREFDVATGAANQIQQRKDLRSRNWNQRWEQAQGSANLAKFDDDIGKFRSNIDQAMRSPEASNPAVRNMLQEIGNEIDRLGGDFSLGHLQQIRANLSGRQKAIPQNAYQAAPRDSFATRSILQEVDNILNNATNNRWSDVVRGYASESAAVDAAKAASRARGTFYTPEGALRGRAADITGDIPIITETGIGRARTAALGRDRTSDLSPEALDRLAAIQDALRRQAITQRVARTATAGGGSNTASDTLAAQAAQQAANFLNVPTGGQQIAGGLLARGKDYMTNLREQALAEALQNPQQMLRLLENQIKAGKPLSPVEQQIYAFLRTVPAAAATQ